MRHIQQTDAARLEALQGAEQKIDVGGGKSGGRLVQHEEIAAPRKRAGDGDDGLLRRGKRADPRLRIDRAIHAFQRVACGRCRRSPVDDSVTSRIAGQDGDILGHRHGIDEPEILVNEGDRQMRRCRIHHLAVPANLPSRRWIDAREDLDQRRFSGAILAE